MSRDTLPWKAPLQPYAAWFGLIFSSIVVVFSGFSVFLKMRWDTSSFVSNYLSECSRRDPS